MNIKYFKIFFIVATLWLVVVAIKLVFLENHDHNHEHSNHQHQEKDQVDKVLEEAVFQSSSQSFESLPLAYQVDTLIQKGEFKKFKEILLDKKDIKTTIDEFSKEDGRTLLTRASFGASLPYIKFLVEELGADVNKADRDQITPLMEAAASENINVVSYLVSKNADVNALNKLGADPLTIALASGEAALARILLQNGSNPNLKWNKMNLTHLMNAARNGHLEVLKLLLDYSAEINAQDDKGNTALHYATSEGFSRIVKTLVSEGANKDLKNIKGETPLDIAISSDHKEIADALK